MIGTFQFEDGKAKAYPGATILSGVFNQDGSNAPYLQPIHVNFNQGKMTRYTALYNMIFYNHAVMAIFIVLPCNNYS